MRVRIIFYLSILTFIFSQTFSIAADLQVKQKAAQWNQQGVNALQQNNYTQAIECFERAREIMPDNNIIRKNLAITYNNYGIALNEQHKTEDAKELLYKAIELEKNNSSYKKNLANVLSSLAAEYYKDGNYDLATRQVKEALSIIPKHVPSLILLGQIHYQMQDLANAEATWKKAYNLDSGNRELRQMLAKLKEEKKIETPLKQMDAYYFDVRFDKEVVDSEIYDIKGFLQEAYRDVGRDFNYYPQYKIPVILYTPEDFHTLRRAPDWVAGIYDGKIRLPIRKNSLSDTEFKRLIWHEYTHAVIYSLTDGKCPVWFNEGLAKYEESKQDKFDLTPLTTAIKNNSLIPLTKLNDSFSLQTDANRLNLAYLEAYSFIDFTLDRWNFHVIKSILAHLKRGKSIEKAFYEETNRTMDKLNNDWKDYLQTYCK